ncbi:hypothetical protein MUK42_15586 [Musa troglodytarum]|uniref:Uncharacterized protein n=1 Tax=Musa troglodytarum TaxID=320322 RepID=A0A9E7HPJ2_9LILI|nr:hypothetical protein MUK42_15586 [Musa troglodytarum]
MAVENLWWKEVSYAGGGGREAPESTPPRLPRILFWPPQEQWTRTLREYTSLELSLVPKPSFLDKTVRFPRAVGED